MNLEKIAKDVGREFGKVMPLRIVKDAPSAYFDWKSITIPERFLEWDKGMIKNVLRHEFGHYFFAPRNPDVGAVINYIASVFGYPNPWIFANILTDLIVDTTNIEIFGEEYLNFLEKSMKNIKIKGRTVKIMAGVYRSKAEEMGMKTSLPQDTVGEAIYDILEDENEDFYLRVMHIAQLLLPYYDFPKYLHFRVYIFSKDSFSEVAKSLIKLGIGKRVINEIKGMASKDGGFLLADPVLVAYERMRVVARYMELEMDMDGMESMQINYGAWNIGDRPSELDILKTLASYGIVLPGVYSLKSERIEMGNEKEGKNYRDSIIILDCSGSMEGEKFERAREASYAIARKVQESGKRAALIPFSDGIRRDAIVPLTSDFSKIEDKIVRIVPLGGTTIQDALKLAIQMGRDYYVYIFSDSDIYDVLVAETLLNKLRGRCTFFLISEEKYVNRWFDKNGIKIVEISPDGVVKKAYEEVRS